MSEHCKPSGQRFPALYRYISALEQGDLDTLVAILNEASHDSALSALLEEVDAVYQAIDGTTVSELEARRALHSVLTLDQNGYLARDQQATFLQHIQYGNKGTLMEEQATLPPPRTQNHLQPPKRKRGHGLQLFAALLVACVLLGVGALFINTRVQTGQAGHTSTATSVSGQPLHGIVVAMAGEMAQPPTTSPHIYGLRSDNGKQVWDFVVPKVAEGQSNGKNLIVQEQSVYVLYKSQVYALQATNGKLLWHANLFNANSPQENYKLLSDGKMLYIGAGSGGNLPFVNRLVALRPTDGSIAWQRTYQSGDATLLATHNGIVYLATGFNSVNSNQLRALRGSDGTQLWAYPGGEAFSVIADDTSVYLFAMASTIRQDLKGMHKDEKVITALNVQNGQPRWTTPVSSNGIDQIQIDQGKLFLLEYHNNGQQICSWRVEDGQQVWCHSFTLNTTESFSCSASYMVANGALHVCSTQTTPVGTATQIVQGKVKSIPLLHQKTIIQVYDASDGQIRRWSTTLDDWSTGNIMLGGKQLFVATAKHVWAVDQSGNVVWNYQNPNSSSTNSLSNGFSIVADSSW
ncbi:hypothetical protein KSD_58970 [Ktedonobacter sp. SOSP1-85]|uniref:outer membrane protein assembly factor BamB family protein n=1 Tax=Ktedonobacter sp. SOSP1-85 TaxID=2778367 RepID=UPI001916399E|nr:PQQ-binding-like beta-propeller repeat protein [Ktedonobacter sp. SOSP1-85]GHO78126.1 hypothetical protein KSD_58970 [Ktedonobacter sp. SOSP1-85]